MDPQAWASQHIRLVHELDHKSPGLRAVEGHGQSLCLNLESRTLGASPISESVPLLDMESR
jgi:hypothetical protein